MPLWNLCLAATLTGGYFARKVLYCRKAARYLEKTLPVAPDKLCRMTRKLARKMNLKNPEDIKVLVHEEMESVMFAPTFTKGIPAIVLISRYLCDEKFGKEKWKAYRNMCENDEDMSTMDLIGNETRDLRILFGLNVPRNYIKFTIAHELAHWKYRDGAMKGIFLPCAWTFTTIWPATNLVLAKVPQLQSLTYFKCEFIANVVDPLLFLDIVGVGSLWLLSRMLFYFCASRLCHVQEFRADRTAAEMDVEMAKAGLMYLRGNITHTQQTLRLRRMQHVWGEFDNDGEVLKNKTHPKDNERIKALEKIIETHNAKKSTGNQKN